MEDERIATPVTAEQRMIAGNMAATLLAVKWRRWQMKGALKKLLGRRTARAQRELVREVLRACHDTVPPGQGALTKAIIAAPSFTAAIGRHIFAVRARAGWRLEPSRSKTRSPMVLASPRFAPAPQFAALDVPKLATSGEVADWLGLPLEQLSWFTDARRQHGRTAIPDLQHYTYAFRPKKFGPPRLIEAPKPRLKTMQRRILFAILNHVPVHEAAHGFVAGRSCITGAKHHEGAAAIVCLDIADFFVTTSLGRVHALFRMLGYPHLAAKTLTRLCSTVTPKRVLDGTPNQRRHTRAAMRLYALAHLPQGAPTSPALANLVAYRLDIRLTGLARTLGATYTRYADDLTFSGDQDFAQNTRSLITAATTIIEDEGYAINTRKTRVMRAANRQQVTGVVVNRHANAPRDEYDRLKAILHNVQKNGLAAENRDGVTDFRAHLEGRINWIAQLNPPRAQKLREMLAAIESD